ncbi:hypothetical protein O9K51_01779 [Purpureocillium lavendulum]|uniref:Uncharacterized protein n=1 Tax=Purpureocillium lavendulum TaxID=1247861 RepID=A0AB34G7D1_9HYPO|nr:hypothetical protein O9K51_01779 [Purpureocillium lavendulum]
MLAQPTIPDCLQEPYPRIVQDLSVLAAELEHGTIVKPKDPNYALMSEATQAINKFLGFIHGSDGWNKRNPSIPTPAPLEDDSWFSQSGHDLWDSEIGFWQELAEHPSLFNQALASPMN